MLNYFIYLIVFGILLFVIIIAVKAISRGIKAKQVKKENSIKNINDNYLDFDQK